MASQLLLLAAGVSLVTAVLYVYIGRRLLTRDVAPKDRVARNAFSIWWLALAFSTTVGTVGIDLLTYFEVNSLSAILTITMLNLSAISLALWGLLSYLFYLYTGWTKAWVAVGAFYGLYFAFLLWVIFDAEPVALQAGPWGAEIVYATPLAEHPAYLPLILLLILPQLAGAMAYFRLFFSVKERPLRYRIAVVSWSIMIWFGSALVASIAGFGSAGWWEITSRFIAVSAALAILAAYYPPKMIARWLAKGVQSA